MQKRTDRRTDNGMLDILLGAVLFTLLGVAILIQLV